MKLVANWRRVLRRAWSIRLIIAAGALSGAEVALPILDGVIDIPRGTFAAISLAVTAAAFVARLVAQNLTQKD
ncbi:hypothetical protein SAMN04488498_104324 [Mesorhizobium albiziae]|uniref:Uncharacterized protein n=1 Tax=Neomesorhizobium albiziae TaxID=335020 RepID=A0A1I3YBE8_9HYPH|nr:hypothetical protein [Mesorhizobium albiziae]GLS29971.1 hypothetical protein GCM10007937_16790 [Mesorhizobium albiziae]SFK29125.1 hypothetical protein SAMN04488498_104324 [Mesorhizobium albiziae]